MPISKDAAIAIGVVFVILVLGLALCLGLYFSNAQVTESIVTCGECTCKYSDKSIHSCAQCVISDYDQSTIGAINESIYCLEVVLDDANLKISKFQVGDILSQTITNSDNEVSTLEGGVVVGVYDKYIRLLWSDTTTPTEYTGYSTEAAYDASVDCRSECPAEETFEATFFTKSELWKGNITFGPLVGSISGESLDYTGIYSFVVPVPIFSVGFESEYACIQYDSYDTTLKVAYSGTYGVGYIIVPSTPLPNQKKSSYDEITKQLVYSDTYSTPSVNIKMTTSGEIKIINGGVGEGEGITYMIQGGRAWSVEIIHYVTNAGDVTTHKYEMNSTDPTASGDDIGQWIYMGYFKDNKMTTWVSAATPVGLTLNYDYVPFYATTEDDGLKAQSAGSSAEYYIFRFFFPLNST